VFLYGLVSRVRSSPISILLLLLVVVVHGNLNFPCTCCSHAGTHATSVGLAASRPVVCLPSSRRAVTPVDGRPRDYLRPQSLLLLLLLPSFSRRLAAAEYLQLSRHSLSTAVGHRPTDRQTDRVATTRNDLLPITRPNDQSSPGFYYRSSAIHQSLCRRL